ncbi:S1/P1 nuclease [soil metagenome]
MRKHLAVCCFIIMILITTTSWAWDNTGHMLVAQIAYEQLTPQAKKQANSLLDVLNADYPYCRGFARAATWADVIKSHTTAFNEWHFIDIPLQTDTNTTTAQQRDAMKKLTSPHIVWAIAQCVQVLQNSKATQLEKALFLRFLLHFVGDIHQPLHCTTRYSNEQLQGDAGGNAVLINSDIAENLHELWDRGAGFFGKESTHYPLKLPQIKILAKKIMAEYPETYFGKRAMDTDPYNWAFESFTIAKNFAYTIKPNTKPTVQYITAAQKKVEEQIALAGYRLGKLLNPIL